MKKSFYTSALTHVREIFDRRIKNGSDYETTFAYCEGWHQAIGDMIVEDEDIDVDMCDEIMTLSIDLLRHTLRTAKEADES